MSFEYPSVLYAFLLLAIPIIIHLFNFRKYKTLYFSSLRFLKQIDEETKSTQKLKHLLVLALRLLAFSALILAFAKPYQSIENSKKTNAYPVLAIYLDNSFSMTAQGTEGELLSEAREQAKRLVNAAENTSRILILSNSLNGIEERFLTKSDALNQIDQLKPSPLSRNQGEVITWIQNLLAKIEKTETIGAKQIALLSDFQKSSALFSKVKADSISYYYPIQFQATNKNNLAVDSIWFDSPNFKMGENNSINIRIKNHGDEALENIPLLLEVNDVKRSVFVNLPEKQETIATINYSDKSPGLKKGSVKIADKQVHFDDDFYFTYEVKKHLPLLLVNGENAVENIARVYSLDSYYKTTQVSDKSLTPESLKNNDLIVLNGLNEIPSGTLQLLVEFVKQGGNLAVFPGAKIEMNDYNRLFGSLNMPSFSTEISSGTDIKKVHQEDPFFEGVFEKKNVELKLPLQAKMYKSFASTTSATNPLLTTQNGLSLLTRSNGAYSVYVFNSSLDPQFGNFTSNALFSTILLRIGERSQRRNPLYLCIGEAGKYPVYKANKTDQAIKIRGNQTEFIPQSEQINQVSYISLNTFSEEANLNAGIYSIEQAKILDYLALNFQSNESDLETWTLSEIQTQLEAQGIKKIQGEEINKGQSLSNIELDKAVEYWRFFILLAFLFLLAEMAILKWMK